MMHARQLFRERLYPDISLHLQCEVIVREHPTPFGQKLALYRHRVMGHILVLDGNIQWMEKDEHIYHETMAHWPMHAIYQPRRVLIVGGGDLGVARELVKYPLLEQIDVVDIDSCVREVTLRYVPHIAGKAATDPRVRKYDVDAVRFIQKATDGYYDIVILDTTDEIGVATPLFGEKFQGEVYRILRKGGIMMRLAGSIFLQEEEVQKTLLLARSIFGRESTGMLMLPTMMYLGGLFGIVVAIKGATFSPTPIGGIDVTLLQPLRWYDERWHRFIAESTPYLREKFCN